MTATFTAGAGRADSFLGQRARGLLLWYARGCLTEGEVLLLLGAACLDWAELARTGTAPGEAGKSGRRRKRDLAGKSRDAV